MTTKTLNGPGGLYVVLDTADAATPAMVYHRHHRNLSSTYDCAYGSQFLDDEIELTTAQLKWLKSICDPVEEAINKARDGHPDYL